MDLQAIASLIGSLGFPIVCCVIMFNQLQKDREQSAALRESDRAAHTAEMEKITSALNNNTIVMQKLIDTLTFSDQSEGKHS